jgi:hypothetical protein
MFSNTKFIVSSAIVFSMLALVQSVCLNDVEWFQASGAVVTVAGVLLAARKIIRLGIEDFIRNEKIIDLGHINPTPEEIEADNEFKADIQAYKFSIWLLIVGTLIWAYGGIILKYFNVGTNA